ncbi:hypothetical protein BH11PLA2_BH11PLA2_31440 [soil metagenome]
MRTNFRLRTLADAFNYHGYGKLHVETLEIDDAWTLVEVANPVMPSLVRESERPVDMLTAGMLGAIFSQIQGRSLDCVQTECPSLGADRSRFLIGSAVRVAEIEQWIEETDPMPSHEEILAKLFHVHAEADTEPELAALAS